MKRVPISLQDFLRDVASWGALNPEERRTLQEVLSRPASSETDRLTRDLIDNLIDRKELVVLDRRREGSTESLLLRDPRRKVRIQIRLPIPGLGGTGEERIPLPLDLDLVTDLRFREVQRLLSLEADLVSSDRVTGSRALVGRFRQLLQDLVPVQSAAFEALEMPAEEAWSPMPWNTLPAPRESLEPLVRRRDHVLLRRDPESGGTIALLGIGDDTTGWCGLLILRHPDADHFSLDRIALAVLISQHFQSLLSTVIRLQGLIFYDFLTGIYNRSFFEDQLEREIRLARRRGQQMALLIVDIDDFKAFNSRYGYDGGDRVLATAACILKSTLRGTDTLARYGGEEFAVILAPPVPKEEAVRIAERLRSALEEEPLPMTDLDGNELSERVTVSVGGALFPEAGKTPGELWTQANRRVIEAKNRGKNQVLFED